MLSKEEFCKGFEKKSFLGSANPSLRSAAKLLDKKMGTNLEDQFKEVRLQRKR